MTVRKYRDKTPNIAATAYVDESAVVIGDVTIGGDSSLWPTAVARGDVHRIAIGARTNVQDGSILHVTADTSFYPGGYALTVGDNVTVGHRAVLHACEVGNYCLIGMGSVILDGAVLAPRVLLGAGSVVAPGKTLKGEHLWLGSPAQCIRPLREEELAYLEFSAEHYVALKNKYMAP